MNTFKDSVYVKLALLILSGICQFIVLSDVARRTVNNMSLLFWLLSIVIFYFAFPFLPKKDKVYKRSSYKILSFTFVIILLAVLVRVILMLNTNNFHIDEYLTAHFSYSLGNLTKLDWFGVYPPTGVWICQFPVLYFFFQKLFFNVFGLSTLTMRFSIIPYIIAIFIFLWAIAKRLYNEQVAIVAILIFAVFSPDLYLSRWSLHFISSTALFLGATYFFILSNQVGKKIHFAVFGFLLGTCYMTYYSSYIALPLFLIYLLILAVTKKISISSLRNFLLSFVVFFYTISPLITYAIKVANFFTQRTDQVGLINGLWSPYQNVTKLQSVIEILSKQTILSLQSLYKDGIGGQAGYWFGKLALFDTITFIFFVISIIYFLFRITHNKAPQNIFVLLTIACAFVTGMVFTIPPPAFHRFSIAFPFIALLIAVAIVDLYMILKEKRIKGALLFLVLCVLAIMMGNIFHFKKVMEMDGPDDPDFPKIQQNITQENTHMVYIASFDSYSLGKVLFIRSNETINSVTHSLDELLKEIPHGRVSYLIIVYPDETSIQKVKEIFPHTKVINKYDRHILLRVVN
jgi:hypothetical protein